MSEQDQYEEVKHVGVTILTVLANVLMVGVIITYFRQVRNGTSVPNPATWLIWTVVSVMNAISYFVVMQGNLWQSLISIVMTVGFLITFSYSLLRGKFAALDFFEEVTLVLVFVIGILWKTTGETELANLALQVIFLISFVLTIRGLLAGKLREKPLPWVLAFFSYVCVIISLTLQPDVSWIAYAYPIVNGILGNGSVMAIILFQQTASVRQEVGDQMAHKNEINSHVTNLLFQKENVPYMFDQTIDQIERMLEGEGGEMQSLRSEFYPDWTDEDLRLLLARVSE
jgi:hypothetical protein